MRSEEGGGLAGGGGGTHHASAEGLDLFTRKRLCVASFLGFTIAVHRFAMAVDASHRAHGESARRETALAHGSTRRWWSARTASADSRAPPSKLTSKTAATKSRALQKMCGSGACRPRWARPFLATLIRSSGLAKRK